MKIPEQVLKAYFGYDRFRPLQKEIILSILSHRDTFGLLPTGAGKSICFQVPSLMMEGTTVVISPLIALMEDQVQDLNKRNIPATYINSLLRPMEKKERLRALAQGKFKLVYLSPEKLFSSSLLEILSGIAVPLLVIDEAHCVSQWGHDFRPDYSRIPVAYPFLKNSEGKGPVRLALTATATLQTQGELLRLLELDQCKVFKGSFDRPNLKYEVKLALTRYSKNKALLQSIKPYLGEKGSIIVYGATRKGVEELSSFLSKASIPSDYYHAFRNSSEKRRVQQDFLENRTKVLVATNAFGLGINKPDTRAVIHYHLPLSLEAYQQEAGRAGRDGKEACCLLIYSPEDIKILKGLGSRRYPDKGHLVQIFRLIDRLDKGEGVSAEELRLHYQLSETALNLALLLLKENGVAGQTEEGKWRTLKRMSRLNSLLLDTLNCLKKRDDDRFDKMMVYAEGQSCLRKALLRHFGENLAQDNCSCSVCAGRKPSISLVRLGRWMNLMTI